MLVVICGLLRSAGQLLRPAGDVRPRLAAVSCTRIPAAGRQKQAAEVVVSRLRRLSVVVNQYYPELSA